MMQKYLKSHENENMPSIQESQFEGGDDKGNLVESRQEQGLALSE